MGQAFPQSGRGAWVCAPRDSNHSAHACVAETSTSHTHPLTPPRDSDLLTHRHYHNLVHTYRRRTCSLWRHFLARFSASFRLLAASSRRVRSLRFTSDLSSSAPLSVDEDCRNTSSPGDSLPVSTSSRTSATRRISPAPWWVGVRMTMTVVRLCMSKSKEILQADLVCDEHPPFSTHRQM